MSAWEHSNGPFNYNATPIGPSGLRFLIHNKSNTRRTWGFCGHNGYIIGPALHNYRCHTVVDATKKAEIISDNVEYRRSYVRQTTLTPKDRIVHNLQFLLCAIKDALSIAQHNHLEAITKLRDLFGVCKSETASDIPPQVQNTPLPVLNQPPREDSIPRRTPPPSRGRTDRTRKFSKCNFFWFAETILCSLHLNNILLLDFFST